MESIQKELKDAVIAAELEAGYCPGRIWTKTALAAIDNYFSEKLEEVEVDERPGLDIKTLYRHWTSAGVRDSWPRLYRRTTTILVRKEGKPVTVSREDAALLARFVEGTPRHSDAVDAAADRVRKAIGG